MSRHQNNLRLSAERKRIDPALFFFLLYAAVMILFFNIAPQIMVPLIFGWYLSLIIEAIARQISRIKFISFKVATGIAALFFFFLLILVVYQIFPILIEEGGRLFNFIKNLPDYLQAQDFRLPDLSNIPFADQLNLNLEESLNNMIGEIATRVSNLGFSMINYVVSNISGAFTFVAVFIVTAVYFTTLAPVLRDNLWRFFPLSTRPKAQNFVSKIYNHFRVFIGGQILIAAIIGILVGVGCVIADIPYALFMGFLAGIMNFVPYLGILITAIPALLLGLTHGGFWGIIKVLVILLATQQLEVWVLSPRIQGNMMRLNWFAILLAVFLCGILFGVAGVLIAIPITVFMRDFWVSYVQEALNRL